MERTFWLRFALSLFVTILAIGNLAGTAPAQVNVTTWHSDTLRTGQNTNETILAPGNLVSGNFGQLCAAALDGQVYAEPLVLSNITFQGTQYASLVYVVTQMNTLYVINGTPPAPGNPCTVVASLSLNPPGQYAADCNYLGGEKCQTIAPSVGALGTPVIQSVPNSNGTLYVVTETQNTQPPAMPQSWYHYLHAVNLDQLAELTGPVRIFPPTPAFIVPQASYWSRHHIQRPGLLLVNNYLYLAFSMMDGNVPLFSGAIYRYDVTNLTAQPVYFATTPDMARAGGGVWQGAAGLAYGPDESGNSYIYFNTGNGTWDGNTNWGDSFVKLDPNSMTVANYFTPADQAYRACLSPTYIDLDFGSGGVMLTPSTSNWQYLAISGDKEGGIWMMDPGSPGKFNQGQCPTGCNACSPQMQNMSNQNLQTVWLNNSPIIHNTAAYWNNYIYIAPRHSAIIQYQLCNDSGSGQPLCGNPVTATNSLGKTVTTNFGATPVVSASGESGDGILWLISGDSAAESTYTGQLYAFDAVSMSQLYVTSGNGSPCPQVDTLAPATKFSVPTVANGYVYLGTQEILQNGVNNGAGTFYIFGLNRTCTQNAKPRRIPAKPHK